jgi:Glycosyl hydrolase 36 superfamily, catalytic domain/Glycosyltransferase family 36
MIRPKELRDGTTWVSDRPSARLSASCAPPAVRRLSCLLLIAALAVAAVLSPGVAVAARVQPPPRLSTQRTRVPIDSAFGSGSFGRWTVDGFSMPAYRYTIDELTAPQARQPELAGSTDAWHQVGNDHIVADAFNHGYTQLWSQDREYQWMNFYDPQRDQFAGGYGYLNVGGRVISTLYDDRPAGARTERDFGVGYFRTRTVAAGLDTNQVVYAPFGDDALLLHDVTIRNTTRAPISASWFEYWGVNPYEPGGQLHHGVGVPSYAAATRTLSVAELPTALDANPLSVYAAALKGSVSGYDTSTAAFFGNGTRARPAAVLAYRTSGLSGMPTPSAAPSRTLFAFRSPVTIAPGASVTLRYAYGYGHPRQIGAVLARYRAGRDPLRDSERAWARWLPQASFGSRYRWFSRELEWDAYMIRSGASYEECAGRHILSQGGYYQYGLGWQAAFRDPLQHMLPMIYADPYLAREVLLYSAAEQPRATGSVPYARFQDCKRFDLGISDDLDLWLFLAAGEYALATRDFSFLHRQVPFADGGSATLWDHLKLAFFHQEHVIGHGPHGGYAPGTNGDWSDLSTSHLQMTESMLVVAQLAYIYPRFATVAAASGDRAFAAELRAAGAANYATLRGQWTGLGWYSRGYSGNRQLGAGAIFGEPQGWAMLAGAPSTTQAATLVRNIRRFLTGIGAPAAVRGPARIGSSLTPAANDPDVTERTSGGIGDNNANFVGGVWFAVNGWLTWGLGTLDRVVPHATQYAWDELIRNMLATHAAVFPNHWDGLLSVDDTCWSYYSSHPDWCGNGLTTSYNTQILHQPTWSLFDAIKLAGIDPTADGYRIDPHLPFKRFSLRMPVVGVSYDATGARGYVRPEASGTITLHIRVPQAIRATVIVWANGKRTARSISHGFATFRIHLTAHQPADWALTTTRARGR